MDPGRCPGGLVVQVYEVPAGRLIFERELADPAKAQLQAEMDAELAANLAQDATGVCFVVFDGDTGDRYPAEVMARALGDDTAIKKKIGPRDGLSAPEWAALDLGLTRTEPCPSCGGTGHRALKARGPDIARAIAGVTHKSGPKTNLRWVTSDPPPIGGQTRRRDARRRPGGGGGMAGTSAQRLT
jgi:hypothetical protein